MREFREGNTHVLVNYGVLTTGFDAPCTNVVVIARPTFSPGLYQQMIGRGLRGPRNGASAECPVSSFTRNPAAGFGAEGRDSSRPNAGPGIIGPRMIRPNYRP
ncbi:MAG: hypothetical protein HYV63_10585 [Candidatus Schekmanbacteria bacterium]|nr:hypothetical protein [Candidatus Schekmanbacteria bacterium]